MQSTLLIKAPQTTKEVSISFDPDYTRKDLDIKWLPMKQMMEEDVFSIIPNCSRESIITFKAKFTLEDNSIITSKWISVLYDIDLISICYNNIAIVIFASIIILIGITYSCILLFNNIYESCIQFGVIILNCV